MQAAAAMQKHGTTVHPPAGDNSARTRRGWALNSNGIER